MTDDPDSKKPGFGDLESPFLFVPHGAPEPVEWMRKHPGWVKFPATFVPRAPAAVRTIPGTNRPWPLDKRGQPWPRSRFGQPLRPLDEYPPGVRAPGEAYTGPIADPAKAVQSYREFMDAGGMGAYDADPYAPIKAYLSSQDVYENPGKYAAYPPRKSPGATAAKSSVKRPPDAVALPQVPQRDGGPEAVPTAAPLAVLGAGVAAAALLGGALGTAPPPLGAKRPGAGGRSATPPLAPLPGFSEAPPPGVAEGYDVGSAGPLKLPTPAVPEGPYIEHGPAADAEQGPHALPMARPKASPEEAERRREAIADKGLPTGGNIPYVPPRHWTSSQPLPRGPRGGYMDAKGREWVPPRGQLIGERHWDVQLPKGGHLNVTKDGEIDHGGQ